MNVLDHVKVVAKTDTETVWQLNRKLLLKAVRYDGYCKVYYLVLNQRMRMLNSSNYNFLATTSSNELSDIFNEVDQLGLMSLQKFSKSYENSEPTRACMEFYDMWLTCKDIHSQLLLLKMFDKSTDIETELLCGRPYVVMSDLKSDKVTTYMYIYRPLSLYAFVE